MKITQISDRGLVRLVPAAYHKPPVLRGLVESDEEMEILAQIELARAQGYARIEQEVEPGLSSVAVPVLNAHGKTVAALNTGFATAATDPARIEAEILPALLRTQDRLRKVLA